MVGVKAVSLVVLMIGVFVPSLPPAAAGHQYDQPVWFNWSKTDLDVLVASAGDPLIGAALLRAIEMWENGIAELGGPAITLRVYWADSGSAPPAGFKTDILVVPQGFMAMWDSEANQFGTPQCYTFAPMVAGWGSFIRVTSHEFGHCLGLSHVFEHGVEYEPGFDIMGGGDGPKCPSNLNIQVLNRVFSGQGGTVSISSGSYVQASSC